MIYVGFDGVWFLLGIIVTLFVCHIVVGIAIAVLEKMTERKKQELEELKQQCLEKGLRVDDENAERTDR
jgi:hypothetical protein